MQISNLSHCILDICVGGSFRIDIIGSLLSKSSVRCYIHVLCFKTFCNVVNGVKQMIVIRAASSEKMPSNKPKNAQIYIILCTCKVSSVYTFISAQ